ncbi:MAG: phosphomannomutase/phosphoglucomutase [Marinilabiliales bacterium]|nr:MAG: phosphomannomutase/phosphoglucomutase [Marinilabiliales bacterium]
MKAFKAYDIRGVWNTDFNSDDVYRIGFYLPELLGADTILIGRDVRVSSPEIFDALTKGITEAGANVDSIGLATTPLVYWATAKYGYKASVQITASHNAPEYNGLKVSAEDARPVGYDSGLSELQKMILQTPVPVKDTGSIRELNIYDDYLAFQSQYKSDLSNLKISMDISNGMAALFARKLFGDNVRYIFEEPDGTFPNHYPNPLNPENIKDLQRDVLENQSDIGVIFDGDADRVMFVDENGDFISPDLMIAVLGNHFLSEGKKARVLQDIRTSKAVGEYLKPMGAEMHMWRVGRAYAALKLKEIDGLFGGELAGHYYFKDFYYSDSGIMAALILLDIFAQKKREGITVSELINMISGYHNSGEINFRIEKKQEAMDAVKAHFEAGAKPTAFYDFDGYRIEYKDWWLNIRPSNTEPYLRFLCEAKDPDVLNEVVTTVKEIVKSLS